MAAKADIMVKPKYKELPIKNLFIVTACYQPSCMYSTPEDTITSSHTDMQSVAVKLEMHKAKGASLIRVSKIINQWELK
jgi:hypothetical protein